MTISIFKLPPAQPILILKDWLNQAINQKILQPATLALATANKQGQASNRIVQVLEITLEGLIFVTHTNSQKGKEIALTGWASGLFYWRELNQQVILSGPVELLTEEESDSLWKKRSITTYAMSIASKQSETLQDEEELRRQAELLVAISATLTRPKTWSGYLLKPVVIEFWEGANDRLHQRLRYDRVDDTWQPRRLQP